MNRKQLEALHRALPEDWTPLDDVLKTVCEQLSLPVHDRAAASAVLLSLSIAGVAQHTRNSTVYRRGVLPPERDPLTALREDEDARLADIRREREEQLEREERQRAHAVKVAQAPERAKAFLWIDERIAEWAALLGFTPEQIKSAMSQLSNPAIVEPLPVEPTRTVTHIPADALVVVPA